MVDRKLEKYLAGYTASPIAEPPDPKKGDPQRSALIQYLIDKLSRVPRENGFTDNDILIVDFGSGKGVLAYEIDRMLPNGANVPYYIAVDLPEGLNALALPPRIHNRSEKWHVNEFFSRFLPENGTKISAVVIRNVLHEMDISQTAQLFCNLNKFIGKNTELYIQDMVTLPEHERGKAGWDPELLCEFMSAIGITSTMARQESYGGTEWFILKANLPGTVTDLSQIENYCVACRRKQHDTILVEIHELNKKTDEGSVARLIQLQGDCTSLSVQLRQWEINSGQAPSQPSISTRLAILGIHVRADEMGAHDFVTEIPENITIKTGLIAILSSKSILDFPALYRSCKRELLFSGYSLRSLLSRSENCLALKSILSDGCSIKILLVNPESEVAMVRANTPSYSNPDELLSRIRKTIEEIRAFNANLQIPSEEKEAKSTLELRLTHRPPPCSYFFIDNKCFLSLYSHMVTGSRAPCFVFSSTDGALGSYFHFLFEDFKGEWERAVNVTSG